MIRLILHVLGLIMWGYGCVLAGVAAFLFLLMMVETAIRWMSEE